MNRIRGASGDGDHRTATVSRRNALALLPLAGGLAISAASTPASAQVFEPGKMTTQAVAATTVPRTVDLIVTKGFYSEQDRGGANWRRVREQPRHPGFIKDAAGTFFEIDEDILLPEMFGASGGDRDDFAAIQQAVATVTATRRRLEFRGRRYSISGEIVIPGEAHRFSLIGASLTELVQLQDDKCIFLFAGENTHHWTISGFRFSWARDQTSRNRNSYAVRFEVDRAGGAGHWNFEISHCILANGFRGFGQADDRIGKRACPIWGAAFRHIHMSVTHTGAAIYLRTYGRSGQPNNRIEQFYARGDNLSEPAIIIESSDTTVLSSIEFNRGKGCQVLVESSSNLVVRGMRFEHVALGGNDAFFIASGRQTNVQLSGISVQSIELAAGIAGEPAIIRSMNGARVKIDGFTDMPWRAPTLTRSESMGNAIAIADVKGGHVTAGFIAPIFDPSLKLARVARGSTMRFTDAETYDFSFEGKQAPVFSRSMVRQQASIVAVTLFTQGIIGQALDALVVECDGKPILWAKGDFDFDSGMMILKRALKSDERRLLIAPGSVLSVSLPGFDPPAEGCSIMLSLVTTGV